MGNGIDLQTALSILQTVSIVLAIVVAFVTIKSKGDSKTADLTEMKVDIKYIKERIEGMEALRDLTVKAKASADSAHKRLDDHLRYEHGKDVPQRNSVRE